MEHASDRPSSAVRVAAVDTITGILDAPQSHAVLRPLLPVMGNLIHDRVEKVRLSVVRMLSKIKSIKGIKYYHVVPVHHLTGRLAAEANINPKGPVAVALTGLVVNSFCPHGPKSRSQEQVNRTIKLVTEDPVAASVFYMNLIRHVPADVVETLAVNLFRCVHASVRSQQGRDTIYAAECRKRSRVDDKEEDTASTSSSAAESLLPKSMTVDMMTKMVETATTLWQSIKSRIRRSPKVSNAGPLARSLDGPALLDLLSFFEGLSSDGSEKDDDDDDPIILENQRNRATSAILSCAACLPPTCVQSLITHTVGVLSTFSDDEPPLINATPYMSLLCSLNMTEDVAVSLATSIESSFEADFTLNFASPEAGSRKRKTSRTSGKSKTPVVPGLPPRVALDALSNLLKGADVASTTARESMFASATASDAIEGSLVRGTRYAERILLDNGSRVSEMECVLRL